MSSRIIQYLFDLINQWRIVMSKEEREKILAIPTYRINRYLKSNAVIEEHVNIKDENIKNYFTFLNITYEHGGQTKQSIHIPGATDIENAYLKAQKYVDIEKEKLAKKFNKPNILGADGGRLNGSS